MYPKNEYLVSNKDIKGKYFKYYEGTIPNDYSVVVGFSGFGNVGYLSLTHIVENLELETFAYWGHSSWFYKDRLESVVTAYIHHKSKTIIIVPRLPIHVTQVSQQVWDEFVLELLSWNCKEYFVIAGLREETRSSESTEWAAFVPSKAYQKEHGTKRTFGDQLAMIGPLSSFLIYGNSLNKNVLGILAYSNFEEDPEASLMVLKEIEKLVGLKVPTTGGLSRFDFSFIPLNTGVVNVGPDASLEDLEEIDEEEDDDDDDSDDDFSSYDVNDLV
jgi:predicted ATP-grasp superfamily ATP-dependent carboligase